LTSGPVVVLAGGTGGAKLARGLLDVVGDDLVVIANTADDVEIHGAYVSPDPDLVAYWLADRIDARGWGVRGDTFAVMDALRELGDEPWFTLGDYDLAFCLRRKRRLEEGARLTDTIAEGVAALGVSARVLPPTDDPLRTWVLARGKWTPFQEFMIRDGGAGPVEGVEVRGAVSASATPEALGALAAARAIVIGPSNPVISIGPILAVPRIREALRAASTPVVAVSPIVHGAVVKGPTEPFMRWAGYELSARGIAHAYAGLIDGVVADEELGDDPPAGRRGPPVALVTQTLMADAEARRRVADETLRFAVGLARPDRAGTVAPK
jgi:LPPG:FO 2-phospho-L-lactate transferase